MSFWVLWNNLKSRRRQKIYQASGYRDYYMLDDAVKNYFNSLTLYELMEQLAKEEEE